jgi:toxin ParE1/3/4
MSSYQLAWAADEDIEDIYVHGVVNFGLKRADQYLDMLYASFDRIIEFPSLGKLRADLLPHIRCLPVGSHFIFYRTMTESAHILRILHERVDVTPALFENL